VKNGCGTLCLKHLLTVAKIQHSLKKNSGGATQSRAAATVALCCLVKTAKRLITGN
jgi:hypothetical protein